MADERKKLYKKESLWGGNYYTTSDPGFFEGMFTTTGIAELLHYLGIETPMLGYTDELDIARDSDFLKSLSTGELEALLNEYTDSNGAVDLESFYNDIERLEKLGGNMPEAPNYEDATLEANEKLAEELAAIEEESLRQQNLLESQLQENQMMFDDYRSQLLGNQYRQNAQLMGTVDSAMSKARRNALEAGASAGLRMAENINTTLAIQNKQSQTSLETSNQLAQQLLNQRQAAAGIRSDYSNMLADKSQKTTDTKRYYDTTYTEMARNRLDNDYTAKYDDWSRQFGTSNLGNRYKGYVESNYAKNKTKSQY